ncbi:alpha/beta hydrolase [Amycolatopsis cihanbeyliensis]|uniref:Alpha/beta hydrolase family protein n=1 Tax=Amycolatopsis cihanbeyliensis TaxID=1128664 RepID=A0A542CTD7_AMYCI|nr:alpha/beta hydrolase [Amycolatopsis cihanbeyliensis]TQI94083.1 alpha/beta hydrolase family protein [Amycolatopsis cihanbeyliensis]
MICRRRRRRLAQAATAVLVPLLLAGATPAVGGTAGHPRQPGLEWRDCPDDAVLKCASLSVPLDHADPGGDRINLALVKAPAADPELKLGSLVLNRGGPGFSSTEYLRLVEDGQLTSPVDQRVWDRYDVIGLDQRGVGQARPTVKCFTSPGERDEFNADVPVFPTTTRQAWFRAAKDAEFAARCRRHTGALLDHMSTAIVARDLDLVRQALGERRLNFLGQSYGVHLGLAYANLFPRQVGSLVLDSVLNPARFLTGPDWTVPSERVGSDVATDATLREFLRLCAEGASCAFAEHDPRRAFDTLMAKLEDEPLRLSARDGTNVTLTYPKLVAFTGGVLYQPVAWELLANMLDLTYRVQREPTESATADLAELVRLIDVNGLDDPYSGLKGTYSAITCNDVDLPDHPLAWWAAAWRRAPAAGRFAALRAYSTSVCAGWQAEPRERYTGPWSVRTEKPILILTSRFDPSTPATGAVHLHHLLPNSRLLVNEGWGHVTSQQSTCVVDATSAYLAKDTLPGSGESCSPDLVPFSAG